MVGLIYVYQIHYGIPRAVPCLSVPLKYKATLVGYISTVLCKSTDCICIYWMPNWHTKISCNTFIRYIDALRHQPNIYS